MDSMEVNKGVAAVLVAGIAFFITGLVGDGLVHPTALQTAAIKVDVKETPGAAAPAAPKGPGPIDALLASANPAAGEADTKKLCVSCHTFNQGGKAGIGPNLYGVVGGPHAHMEGFNYTAGLKAKVLVHRRLLKKRA